MRVATSLPAWSAAIAVMVSATAASAATNILPTAVTGTTVTGVDGVLRGPDWSVGATPSSETTVYDEVFEPEGQQWNIDSFWWDQDPTVNPGPVSLALQLDRTYVIEQFIIQADDNDAYRIEYWNGSAWETAWDVPTLPSFGLRTRPTFVLATPITTNALRVSGALPSDNYYGVSELQAIGTAVPEPGAWALMIGGFGLAGTVLRSRRRRALAA